MLRDQLLVCAALLCVAACTSTSTDTESAAVVGASAATADASPTQGRPEGWDEYWYSGLAEVNSYDVQQERYGELRPASEVLVFVTEPFLLDAQVKDDGLATSDESISIFKLNRLEKFTTGIYDYALMLSVFTPVSYQQHPHTLKATFSSQDWCGQVWQQINRRRGDFAGEVRSYFQAEGDRQLTLDAAYLEDELVSRVRIDPASLPSGKTTLVPAAKFSRLRHVEPAAEEAVVRFRESPTDATHLLLDIDYPALQRQVVYTFDAAFPHKLLAWTERYKGTTLSTGTLKTSLREKYWSQNATAYDAKRTELGL